MLSARWLSRHELASSGLSRRDVSALVSRGSVLRLRRGRYLSADAPAELRRAGELGGRLDCVSLLLALGVFVREPAALHLQFDREASRLPPRPAGVIAHWRSSDRDAQHLASDVVAALAQAVLCQRPRDAIATLDSAWHQGWVDEADIGAVFSRLPRRFRRLRALLDARSESGPETLVRLMLRGLGCEVRLQVVIDRVGRVDLLVDGWLIIECDSRRFHEGWAIHKRDRRRDLHAAALGYTTVRPLAEDIMSRPDEVLRLLRDTLAHGPR